MLPQSPLSAAISNILEGKVTSIYGITTHLNIEYNAGWNDFVVATDAVDAAKKAKVKIDDVNEPALTTSDISHIKRLLMANMTEAEHNLEVARRTLSRLKAVS
jgi:hypothetical protein